MRDATVTSKNQITIPRDVRRELDLERGDQLAFEKLAEGVVVMKKKAPVVRSDGAAVPFIKVRLSLAEMKAAAARGALESARKRNG